MRRIFAALILVASIAFAQPPVAPTGEGTGNPAGENVGNYNVMQSFELGYRWRTTGGDADMYRSTVNYGNGIRLLSSSLSVQSREGHGHFFDHILLTTQGIGNDPYQFASLRMEKNRLYRYDMMWRSTDYFNPALTISNGQHLMDTTRRMQDHDLTLFPQSSLRFFLGYSRNLEIGPALSTIQLFDSRGDEFPLFSNVHRVQNEYRAGAEVRAFGIRLNFLHGWQDFKEDTPTSLLQPSPGNNPTDLTTLASLQRAEPYHGTSPYWRVALFREGLKLWAVNGRFTYVAGKRDFVQDQTATGASRFGAAAAQQVLTFGNAQRPALNGYFNISVFPASTVTVTNQTSVSSIRMIGNAYFVQYDFGVPSRPVVPFQYLGILTVTNSTVIDFHPLTWFGVHAGYDFSDRRIRSVEGQQNFGDPPPAAPRNTPIEQTNRLNAGTLGFRIKPLQTVTITLDGELGRADHPIYPISEKNYDAFRGRIEYKRRALRLAAYVRSDYNTNSNSLTSYASRSRQYGADASWAANERFSIDASYGKLHLNTLGGIDYFVGTLDVSDHSLYISNIHTASLGARFSFLKRADFYAGFSHVQDVGDGRRTPYGDGSAPVFVSGSFAQSAEPFFLAAQTFPLRFLSPQARLSIALTRKIRWNAGYQYYGYHEEFSGLQNYRAHTGYSSLSWSF